jgi:hypothetical protein
MMKKPTEGEKKRNSKLERAGKGRPKGAKNKLTTNIKTAFLKAFEDLGGAEGLTKWGKLRENKGDFYKMIAKMLPAQIVFDEEKPLLIKIEKKIISAEEKGKDE